jgi:hypothetical protein
MKKILIATAALMLLTACEPAPAPQGECAECAKMAADAKAKHGMMMKHGENCPKGDEHMH